MPFQWTNQGGGWIDVASRLQDLSDAKQMAVLRDQAAIRQRLSDEQARRMADLKFKGDQYTLRGQLLGTVETPEDYSRVMPILESEGLPTQDLPEQRKSEAWLTFAKKPEVTAAPAWLADKWRPAGGPSLPTPTDLPEGPMQSPGVDPMEIATSVRRAAERGLSLDKQQRFQDQELGRILQKAQIQANLEKYATQDRYREAANMRAQDAAALAKRRADIDAGIAATTAEIKRKELETAGPGGQALTQSIKELPAALENAKTAKTGLQTIDRMQELLGEGAGARPGMIKVGLGRLFGYQSDEMARAEEYQLLAETLRGPLREDIVGPGPMTEAEQRLLGQVTGGGATGRKAATALLNLYRAKAVEKISGYNRKRERLSKYDATIPDLYEEIKIGEEKPPRAPAPAPQPSRTARNQQEFNAIWATLKPGETLVGPDGRAWKKGGGR
jgi:hypothetical protein